MMLRRRVCEYPLGEDAHVANEAIVDPLDHDRIDVTLTAVASGHTCDMLLIDDIEARHQTRRYLSAHLRRVGEQVAIPCGNGAVSVEEDLALSVLDAAVRSIV